MVMVFSSVKFLLYFLPIFLILYGLVPERIKNLVLLAGSLIFYALGDVKSLPLLMMSVSGPAPGKRQREKDGKCPNRAGTKGRKKKKDES